MNRRTFLQTTAASAAAVSLSGCLGYSVVPTTEVSANQRLVTELSDEVEAYDEQVASLSADGEANRERIAELEAENERLEADADRDLKHQLLSRYKVALAIGSEADDDWDDSVGAWNDELYADASQVFAITAGYYHSLALELEAIGTQCDEAGLTVPWEQCVTGTKYAENMALAAINMSEAADYYSYEEYATGNDYFDDSERYEAKAEEYEVVAASVFERALGLTGGRESRAAVSAY